MVQTAARVAGDEEWSARRRDVLDTARNLSAGKPATGGPTVANVLRDGDRVGDKLSDWLSLGPGWDLPAQWEPPLPFMDMVGPPFPADVLPESIEKFAEAQAIALQTPLDLTGCLVLGAGAVAGAGRCVVRLDQEWTETLNLFIVITLPSGERKSPAFRAIMTPLEERELTLAAEPEIASAQTQADIRQKRIQDLKSRAAKAKSDGERDGLTGEASELARELAAVSVPNSPRLLADDATSEAVASLLAQQGGRLAVMSTEGGLFETLAGRYSEGVLNIDVYLKGFSGDTLRVDRKGRPPEFVREPALTLCLTVQPEVIRGLGGKRGFRGRGLLARFLYSVPRSLVGYRSTAAPPVPDDLRKRWRRVIKDLLKIPDPPEGQEHAIRLSEEGAEVFQAFRNRVEIQLRPGADLYEIQDFGNKLPGAVARIAGILHLFAHPEDGRPWELAIEKSTMEAAIRLGDYFNDHADLAFGMMGADPQVGEGPAAVGIDTAPRLRNLHPARPLAARPPELLGGGVGGRARGAWQDGVCPPGAQRPSHRAGTPCLA